MARALLVSYCGYPDITSLMPDNGLANLAGSLVSEGHHVKVLDFATIDTMRRLVPEQLRTKLRQLWPEISSYGSLNDEQKGNLASQLVNVDQALTKYHEQEAHRIADEVVGVVQQESPDFVGFKLWVGDGLDPSIQTAQRLKKEFPGLRIYGGGPLIDQTMDKFYHLKGTDAFDAVSYAEGEETILALAAHSVGKAQLAEIPNLVFRNGDSTVTTALNRPSLVFHKLLYNERACQEWLWRRLSTPTV